VGKLGWVSQEKNRCVIGNDIEVAFAREEFHRESARVTGAIVRTGLATDRGESSCDWTSLALLEDIRQAEILQGVCRGIVAMRTSTLNSINKCNRMRFGILP